MNCMSVIFTFLLVTLILFQDSSLVFAVEEADAERSIALTESEIVDCYGAAADADDAGANVTDLLAVLEESGWLLSKAKLAYNYGDFGSALNLSDRGRRKLEGLVDEAWNSEYEAIERGRWDFAVFFVSSLVGGVMVVIGGFLVWPWLKRRYGVEKVGEYGLLFFVVVGVVALVVASPGLSRLLVYPRTEFFTEFWVLDSEGRAENYPYNISSGEDYGVILGIGDRLGYCGYYLVEVKFRNLVNWADYPTTDYPCGNPRYPFARAQPAPESFDGGPSSLPSLFNVSAFVEDEGVWQWPLAFSFDYECNETLGRVRFDSLTLNDAQSDMDDYRIWWWWNSTDNGLFGDLFFELWIYDKALDGFEYHDRFLRLKLNMIGS